MTAPKEPREWKFELKDWTLDVLMEQAERQGFLLAKVAEDGTLIMSGNETRLKQSYARVQARLERTEQEAFDEGRNAGRG